MSIPRLGLQSGFSFKQAYGSTDLLIERCLELGITQAALCDVGGTWGHVPWEISANAVLSPALSVGFGERRPLPLPSGTQAQSRRPSDPDVPCQAGVQSSSATHLTPIVQPEEPQQCSFSAPVLTPIMALSGREKKRALRRWNAPALQEIRLSKLKLGLEGYS